MRKASSETDASRELSGLAVEVAALGDLSKVGIANHSAGNGEQRVVGDVVPLSAEIELGGFSEVKRETAHSSKIKLVVARSGEVVGRGTGCLAEGVVVATARGKNRLLAGGNDGVEKRTLSRNGLASRAGHYIGAGGGGASGCCRGSRCCRVVSCPGLAFAPFAVLARNTTPEVGIEGSSASAVSLIGLAGGAGKIGRAHV